VRLGSWSSAFFVPGWTANIVPLSRWLFWDALSLT
jgi:hypothetical protein